MRSVNKISVSFGCLISCFVLCSSEVRTSSLPPAWALAVTETNPFEDLARGVSARGIGGIYIAPGLSFEVISGDKKEAGSDTTQKISVPYLKFTQYFRVQLDEGVDLGIMLLETFIGADKGGYNTIFDATKQDGDATSLFVFGGEVFFTYYMTQTLFASAGTGGKGWLKEKDKLSQGMLFFDGGVGFAAPLRESGVFFRPEIKANFSMYWTDLQAASNSADWERQIEMSLDFSAALSYRYKLPDLLVAELMLKGFGIYSMNLTGIEQPAGKKLIYPGTDYEGEGWHGGMLIQIVARLGDDLLLDFAPISELSFTLSYGLTTGKNDYRFTTSATESEDGERSVTFNKWYRHSFRLVVNFRLW